MIRGERGRFAPTAAALLIWAIAHIRLRLAIRALAILLGFRRPAPVPGSLLPYQLVIVPRLPRDTGGAYRPAHRMQDPSHDPKEPNGSESSSKGQDHGWSNCTMASGADALAYETGGAKTPQPGDMRHRQSDLEGGTDLYDLRDAWADYGCELKIKSGSGWSALREAHDEGRPIVIQGTGNVPGAGTFTGGHACCIGIETKASSGDWLWGDPLVSDWQWVPPAKIRDWAEAWQTSIAWAHGSKVAAPPPPEPEPEPEPCPDCPPVGVPEALCRQLAEQAVVQAGDAVFGLWVDYLLAPRPTAADRWDRGSWIGDAELWDNDLLDPCAPELPAAWNRNPIPYPVGPALVAVRTPPAWDRSGWRAALWG